MTNHKFEKINHVEPSLCFEWNCATVLATAKLTSFSFLLKNEDAYFKNQKRIFQRKKTQKIKNAKKTQAQKKNEDA